MSKKEKLANFDPNGIGLDNGHFIGLPFEEEDADLVIVSIPWEVTASYGAGTATGPVNILQCSRQLDLYDADFPNIWRKGIFLRPSKDEWFETSRKLRRDAEMYLEELESGKKVDDYKPLMKIRDEVNRACLILKEEIEDEIGKLLDAGKKVGVLGGDHSCPLGFLSALAKRHDSFGVLQIDAHQDLRKAYEGFEYSHASIFYNALGLEQMTKLIQLGIRDHCDEEVNMVNDSKERIIMHSMDKIRRHQYAGNNWSNYVDEIIKELPEKVYISFDIDGLDPSLCPNTGTPVPGGFSFSEIRLLLKKLNDSGKEIIGFDLCEVAGLGNEWDGNVGARILYNLSNLILDQ